MLNYPDNSPKNVQYFVTKDQPANHKKTKNAILKIELFSENFKLWFIRRGWTILINTIKAKSVVMKYAFFGLLFYPCYSLVKEISHFKYRCRL
jgi:hypothetical protein